MNKNQIIIIAVIITGLIAGLGLSGYYLYDFAYKKGISEGKLQGISEGQASISNMIIDQVKQTGALQIPTGVVEGKETFVVLQLIMGEDGKPRIYTQQ